MTSDAKIGLLLGLVFIFIIAFIINGLPNLRGQTNSNELTNSMVNFQDDLPGLAGRERKAQEVFNWSEDMEEQSDDTGGFVSAWGQGEEIRSVHPLPGSVEPESKPTIEQIAATITTTTFNVSSDVKASESGKSTKMVQSAPKTYVVEEGDSLASIAKKFYGSVHGNKKANIDLIFKANRKELHSPDEIYVGQKLVIPVLGGLGSQDQGGDGILAGEMFDRVVSIGKKQLSDDGKTGQKLKFYIVQQDDSLWKIAAKALGNGSRYAEIKRLNSKLLKDDEDFLSVGMRLRLPVQ